MDKLAFVGIFSVGILPTLFNKALRNLRVSYLWISVFILWIPFQEFTKNLYEGSSQDKYGVWGSAIGISLPILIASLNFQYLNFRSFKYALNSNKWIIYILFLSIVSLLNPLNYSLLGTITFIIFFVSIVFMLITISGRMSQQDVILGIRHTFVFLSILQLFLSICFPVLDIKFVTNIFHGQVSEQWSTRVGTRVGAVGVFLHPGNLALFSTITSSFFLSLCLLRVNRRMNFCYIVCNAITILLTFSRTSYITYVLALGSIYFFYINKNKKIISIKNIFVFIPVTILMLYWIVYLSPVSEIFLHSDVNEMYEARTIHWFMGLAIFKASPMIGVGINNHLAYLTKDLSIIQAFPDVEDFFITNPIHNIHLIVLAETGLVGIILWVSFLGNLFLKAVTCLKSNNNYIFSLTTIGTLTTIIVYGITGWAPFSKDMLPLIILLIFNMNFFSSNK